MSGENVTRLETVKTDVEKAREYRNQMAELLKPVGKIMTEAKRDGINISFNLTNDAMGNFFVATLIITKELKD